jgi:shikimate 5-dehydrogenase
VRGRKAAEELGLELLDLAEFDPARFEVVVNATPLGRQGEMSVDVARLPRAGAFVDLAYGEETTPAVAAARARGLVAVDGREVLLHQALAQFRLMTGREAPIELGRQVLGLEAGA